MPNHFHLLLAPDPGQSISRILQSLTVAHTWHYHQAQGGTGHVWQGRFKSPVIQSDEHALVVLRYVEANPLRAGLTTDPAGYRWSSYGAHGLGRDDPLLSPLPAWDSLGPDEDERRAYWRRWVQAPLTAAELTSLRHAVVSGRPFGAAAWAEVTALRLGLRLAQRPRGRPRKCPEK
jgi:putative transposase